jgi:hypothetical protein
VVNNAGTSYRNKVRTLVAHEFANPGN